jgi:Spy/CpxP family protein refolding chaperone
MERPMTEPTSTTPTDPTPAAPPRRRRRTKHLLVAGALAAVLIAAGAIAAKVSAHGPGFWHARAAWSDPAKLDAGVERMVKHFAVEVDATPDQQARLAVLAKAAARDLLPLHDKLHSAGDQAAALLTASAIDRTAIERLRREQIETAEGASARLARLLADAADVLTPEQRQKLAAHVAERRERRR